MWFQIGGSTSEWHGVYYTNDGSTLPAATDLLPVSVTNSNFAANTNFDDNSEFRGQLLNSGTYEAVIWRFVPRWEQTEDDESYVRIEKARILQCEYD